VRRQFLGLLPLLLCAPGVAWAQKVELGGFAEVDHFSYLETESAGQIGRGDRGLLQLRGTARLHDRVELFAAGELRGSWAARGEGRGYLNEGYADLLFPGVDLRVGKQTIVWGRTDVVNPTDQLAPREFSDPLETDDERLGVLAARLRASIGRARVEGVIAPSVVLSRLPGSGSRWAPTLPPTVPDPADPARTLKVRYSEVQAGAPAAQMKNAQYAARLSTTLRGWDLSVSYFDGWDDLPATRQRIVPVDEGEVRVELRQEYSRRRAVGGDLATTLGPYSLRAEGAHLMPDSLGGPDYFQYVVGLERFFGDPLGAGSTLLLVQWIQEITPRDSRSGPFDLNHVFRRSLMARAQHNLTPALRLAADGVYDFRTEGYYLQPGASFRLWDRLLVEGSIDLLGGGNEAFFGAFAGNNRLRTTLRYSF
jgi:hypothetical protein